ncbi:MAG: anaerobic ribonucleoside-triphosphate reductase activating protein [Erysipelotrichaceae bacterium]|nr:anaerobic ribonucleoside-triphosphate reductase activating protein [Erysipelotrichaceae bacterium]
MEQKKVLLNDNSILYRCTQKYYDRYLEEYQLSAGQVQFLLMIYEHEGLSMQQLAKNGSFDKGTVSKGVQKLEENGYIRIVSDVNDKRIKCLYTTDSAKAVIAKIYEIRRQWGQHITQGLTPQEIELYVKLQHHLSENAQKAAAVEEEKIRFFGLQKLTLLDYPGKMACTLFTGGCNFRCPFCHNADLVFLSENTVEIPQDEIINFLNKRGKILEGVCITGGEPLLHPGLEGVLRQIKKMGYLVKLDTNGSFPDPLRFLIEEGLVDHVAMDIKNAPSRYGETAGIDSLDLSKINESVQYLMGSPISYEFRCTVVQEFHDEKSMEEMAAWLKGADVLYLQQFEDSERVIKKGLHAHDKETLKRFSEILSKEIHRVEIRGL